MSEQGKEIKMKANHLNFRNAALNAETGGKNGSQNCQFNASLHQPG